MSDIITTLKSKSNPTDSVYPNIIGDNIPDASITTAKISDGAITTAKISDGAITEAKVSNGAITESKIGDGAIATAKIQDNSITGAKIRTGEITTSKISDGAITTPLIENNAITTGKIENNAITPSKLNFHLYQYNINFEFTHNLKNYKIWIDLVNTWDYSSAPSNADFLSAWNLLYGDTYPHFTMLNTTDNTIIEVEFGYNPETSKFDIYFYDGSNTSVHLASTDFDISSDWYRSKIF